MKKEIKYRKGQQVEIVNRNNIFSTYSYMAKLMKAKLWVSGANANNGEIGTIKAIKQHPDINRYGFLALVRINKKEIIIGIDGLKLVKPLTKKVKPKKEKPQKDYNEEASQSIKANLDISTRMMGIIKRYADIYLLFAEDLKDIVKEAETQQQKDKELLRKIK